MKSKLEFHGGVGSVTGANFLLDTGGARLLVDCGLIQGDRSEMSHNQTAFPYDPSSIDILLVTHAHSDHIGRIPKLVKDGFKGVIYSTEPTRALAEVMLNDSFQVMVSEEERYDTPRLYDKSDIAEALGLWRTIEYHETVKLKDDVSATFTDAGHILGSACITLERSGRKIVFSGDIGNNPQPLMNPPEVPSDYHYLVMESVYGNRNHEHVNDRRDLLKQEILNVVNKKGTLIIPTFSVERTQGMLFEINNLVEAGEVPPLATFLDSPLAIAVTEIYKDRTRYLKTEVQEQINKGDDIFDFPKLKFTRSVQDSRVIQKTPGPKIIIAGSGMSHGGRILGHERHYLEDPTTTLLMVGYQAVGSVGRRLQDGAKRVTIDRESVQVRARIATIQGWSGHADRDQLVDFVSKGGEKIEEVFVVMGEERASLFLVQRLRDYLGVNAVAPNAGESKEINF